MSFSKRLPALALALAATAVGLVASAKLSKSGAGAATFKVSGPAGMNIEGTSSDVNVGDDGTTVTITVGLSNLSTGISLRDKHTKDALETDKYSTAELKVARAALKFADGGGDARGSMKIHGQTKDVTFRYTAKKSGDTYDVNGTARINMNDFGIKTPSYLGVSVKPDVDITTHFGAKDN